MKIFCYLGTWIHTVCSDLSVAMFRYFTVYHMNSENGFFFALFRLWLVGFGFNGPLRQYFSLYRAVSQREGERGKKG